MDKSVGEKRWNIALIVFILILGGIVFFNLQEFVSGFLGAFTLYVLMRNQMMYLTEKKKIRPAIASFLLLLEGVLLFLIPISLISIMLADKISMMDFDFQLILEELNNAIHSFEKKIDFKILSGDIAIILPKWGMATVQSVAQSVYLLIINSVVMIFILYFLFISGRKIESIIRDILPLKEQNKKTVLHEVKVMIRANAIGIPLLALIVGGLALIGYFIFGVNDPFFYAMLTAFASIVPLIGSALVWLPLGVSMILADNLSGGIGLLLYGAVIFGIDSLIRSMLQKRMTNVHPIITVFGIIVGLKLFGFWGIIFGPVLLSLLYLCISMYRKEYVRQKSNEA